MTATKATVYTFYGAAGEPLYVGVTTIGLSRYRHHRSKADWFDCVATARFEHFTDAAEAYAREVVLIRELRPQHNIVGVGRPAPSQLPLPDSTASRIRSARMAAALTQQEVADALGIDQRTVTRWETGQSPPRVRNLREFASLTGTSLDDLRGERLAEAAAA